ncbi:type I polyketide synthase [Mycobacterium sp. Aquia_213]|uniref:type I polyketide synthase n=1 Tax=Mycobacterium sp. Aquia_213 TaxID=2991728 RepID=UPI00226E77C7|nr:acyltransferase domain-containing protein [Mycobacterium sp. Aquia_213]WAC89320.1 acyltransferase domain-containing protein [Mycobacterium sp. Aquia_213]
MSPTDVAIIGLACRLPGAATPRDFWHLVRDGLEETRLPGDTAEFDADFFNLSPREARAMDPRQRMALELAWELFEDAFLVPETLRGEQVSIFLGAMTDDYAVLTLRDGADNLDHHSFGGVSRAMIANRISYALGLQGSSMIVDTGQSSSLVAVHLACESLHAGESSLAIAGGIHLNLADETAMLETEFGAMSTSGHTYAFDGRADGYVRAQGAGMVLLKPLTAAIRDGNRIRAVIRGSAVGNAGHSSAGQTVPSVPGQADVIRRALARAGLGAADIDYVEAHGTGTEVGDPVEARALGEIFAARQQRPVRVGSVKTNIGHTGSAAGIAGLLKAVLAVENAEIPPSLHYDGTAPGNDLKSHGLQVNTALAAWPNQGRLRRAGVSSFGMGGTNAHVILEEAPAQPESVVAEAQQVTPVPWMLSARSGRALINQAARLAAYVASDGELTTTDVAWSLATTRSAFEHRAVLVGSDREALTAGLTRLAAGESGAVAGRARGTGKTVFVFPGQGSQWLGMGRQLYDRFPVFARAFDEAVDALDAQLRSGLRDVMWGQDPELLANTEFAQPALFAVEVALATLLQSWGAEPDLVMGHSVGEITAAHVAGVLTLDDAARLVAARGRLMAGLPGGGVMIAVAAGEDDVMPLLTDGVAIAAVNAPSSVVLSGAEVPVGAVADRLAQRGVRAHRLAVSHAFHSVLVEPMIDEFARLIADIKSDEPRIGLVSNVTGQLAGADYGSAQYWAEHVRCPVRFVDGVRLAESLGATVFVEVGPAAGLSAAVEQSLNAEHAAAVATLVDERPEIESLLTAAGQLFVSGVAVDWRSVLNGLGGRRVELPTYGFARQRFWLDSRADAPAPLIDRAADLAGQLRALAPEDQRRQLVELVCAHAATVLGHSNSRDIDVERAFSDIGFESLTGVELRNRLKAATGLALSRTLIFDFPTPSALAEQLRHQLLHDDREDSDDEKTWQALKKIPLRELRRTGLLDKLLLLAGESEIRRSEPEVDDDVIDSLSPDALIAMALESDRADDVE